MKKGALMNMKTNKILRRVSACVLSVCAAVFLASAAFAADYHFGGAEDADYYPSTDYETVFGSRYQYGGLNAVDMGTTSFPFGVSDGTAIGAAERVTHADLNATSGIYGAQLGDVFIESPVPAALSSTVNGALIPYVYKPNAYTPVAGMELSDGSLGTVQIPSLNIEVKVWEGENTASMAKGLGHYSSSSGWDGNVCVCGHNRGVSFAIGGIKDLAAGDIITYTTVYGTRTYEVSYVGIIANNDWSHLQATSDNRITLTTCLANQPEYRVCVQAVEAA